MSREKVAIVFQRFIVYSNRGDVVISAIVIDPSSDVSLVVRYVHFCSFHSRIFSFPNVHIFYVFCSLKRGYICVLAMKLNRKSDVRK